jgi:hypothetical protein
MAAMVSFPQRPRRFSLVGLTVLLISFVTASPSAQQTAPWKGVLLADEARADGTTADGITEFGREALSGDGRYLVFSSARTLTANDTNGLSDVFVRDRQSGTLTRVSVSGTGDQAEGESYWPSISRDGRHIIFPSCAANLVPDDVNGRCDMFVHDRISGSTTRLATGLVQPNATYSSYALSADGRYAAFVGELSGSPLYNDVWFHDRDADADGAMDEPGETSTTQITQPTIGGLALFYLHEVDTSADGRWIAFTATTTDPGQNNPVRMFLHDRSTSTTVVVDAAQYPHAPVSGQTNSFAPDLSDDGHLAYYSSRQGLIPDSQYMEHAYVVDPATLLHTKVQQTHATGAEHFGWGHTMLPAISADGRYVTYIETSWSEYMYVADMQTGVSYDVIPSPDGWPGLLSISADGSSIAFAGSSNVFPTENGLTGLFVANRIAMSPAVIDASNDGGTYEFTLEVPAWMPWELDTTLAAELTVSPLSGTGPATITVDVPPNFNDEDTESIISFGPAEVTIRQDVAMMVEFASPPSGPAAGGDGIIIVGRGFKEGATVTFGGTPVVDLELWDSHSMYVTAPPHLAGTVDIVVTNPDAESATMQNGYTYIDDTPPVVSPILIGTLGNNEWYTSNVIVQWSVVDEESAITEQYCDEQTFTTDADLIGAGCSATSAGGETQMEVSFKRDATPPYIDWQGGQFYYYVGEPLAIGVNCVDQTSGVATCAGSSPGTGTPGEYQFTVTATDLAGNQSTDTTPYIVLEKLTPTVTWSDPSPMVAGAALGAAQLNATASVPGTFIYTPASGTVLGAGTHTLSTTFTPNDTVTYNTVTSTVTLTVKTLPVITWNPAPIAYPSNINGRLNASANVAGTFVYDPPAGTVLTAGTHTLSVTFTPANTAEYATATANVQLQVLKGNPGLSWPNSVWLIYGTALGNDQLTATAAVPGTFAYTPAAGAMLDAGPHTLSVTFTPTDSANYESSTRTNSLTVYQQQVSISWNQPAPIVWGTPLGPQQQMATAGQPGTFTYSPAPGTILEPGVRRLDVTFVPDDANYANASEDVFIVVDRATPVITWSAPQPIVYGTALGGAQLNATAEVAGWFSYSPSAGTTLAAGTHNLQVTFTATDFTHYTAATKTVTLVVEPQAPVITWNNPAPIVYGTALGGLQNNPSASVAGSFAFTPATGAVLNAGNHTLSVTFTPTSSNYATATATVSLTVAPAATTITWSNPPGITYGTALSGTQLNASGSVAGTLVYSPAAGTVLGAGTHTLSVTLTPASPNYAPSTTARSITVGAKALTVSTNNASKVYGQALPAFTIGGAGFVNGDTVASLSGTPAFSTSATATSAPGNYNVTPGGVTSANYTITFAAGTLTISKANTTVTLTTTPSPSNHNQTVTMRATVAAVAPGAGTPTGTVQFRDNGVLIGTATVVNGVATLNKSLRRGSHPLTATYVASTNFNSSVGSKTHQVN